MSDITGDDLREYRDVAAAFPKTERNPANSWEVHRLLMNHPDRAELIKQAWTEKSLTAYLNEEIRDNEIADRMIAEMQAAGEIRHNPNGTVSVNAKDYLKRLPSLEEITAMKALPNLPKHEYVVGAPDDRLDPLGLKRTVSDIIAANSDADEVKDILLEMEREGLIEALPDGQMLVKGTREDLMRYGIDPTDKSIFDGYVDQPKFRTAEQDEIDKYLDAFAGGNPDLVLCHDPAGGNPLLFPRAVLARALANGESWTEFTEAETKEWKRKGPTATVNMVLNYNPDGQGIVTNKADLDEAWARSEREVTEAERRLGVINQKVAYAATSLLAETEEAETPGWTLPEITKHLNTSPDRAEKIIGDMYVAGHLEVFTRDNGEKAYRLNTAGREVVAERVRRAEGNPDKFFEDFDDTDPRVMNKQWFADLNSRPKKGIR